MTRANLFALGLFLITTHVDAVAGANLSQNVCNSYYGLNPSLGITNYWRFLENSGTSAADSIGSNPGVYAGGVTLSQQGSLLMPGQSISLDGSSGQVQTNVSMSTPNTFSYVVWFKTSTTNGGLLVGFGDQNVSQSSNYDRHIYMTNSGTLIFGVYANGVYKATSAQSYNDNKWHMVAASMGSSGMLLSVDGGDTATNTQTSGNVFNGFIHIGYNNLNGWDSQPSSPYFSGSISEVAFSPTTALTIAQMKLLYGIGSTCGNYIAPPPTLAVQGSSQTIKKGNCSAAVTVKPNASVQSPLTVNLSGSGLNFYSDIDCTSSISSTTINSTTTPNFYFIPSSTGSIALTAAASGYISGTQIETVTTNPFVWTGGGANNKWNTAANWSGGAVPSSTDLSLFDGTCASNCSPKTNASIDVGGIRMASDYAGNITQGNFSATVENNFVQLAGSFTGATGYNVTINNNLHVTGGTFKAPSGTLQISGNISLANSTFTANSGLFSIPSGGNYHSIDMGNNAFNTVHLDFSNRGGANIINTWTVNGDFTVDGSNYNPQIDNGTVNIKGNISYPGGQLTGGTALIRAVGVNQTITASGFISSLEIASTGTTTLSGTIQISNNFTYTSGTISASGSTISMPNCLGNSAYKTLNPGNQTYNNVTIDATYCQAVSLSGTMNVTGNLSISAGNYGPYINGGTFQVSKDVSFGGSINGGSTAVQFVGSGTQNFTVNSNSTTTGTYTVNNASSQVVLTQNATNARNTPFVVTAGAIYLAGYTLVISSLSLNGNTVHTQDTSGGGSVGTLYVGGSAVSNGSAYGGTVGP